MKKLQKSLSFLIFGYITLRDVLVGYISLCDVSGRTLCIEMLNDVFKIETRCIRTLTDVSELERDVLERLEMYKFKGFNFLD